MSKNINWKLKILIALSTGAIGVLSFSPYDIWPAAIVSLTSLLLLISAKIKKKQVAILGFSWGFGLFSTGLYWIYIGISKFSNLDSIYNILLVILLYIYLSFYPMLFAVILVRVWTNNNLYRLIFGAPIIWLINDYIRSKIFTGFPWLEFGYSQINGPLKFLAPISGVESITFVLVMISGALTFGIKEKKLLAILPLFSLILLQPLCSINWYQLETRKKIKVALIQGNIKPSLMYNTEILQINLNKYLSYTLPYVNKANIIIWPESAITFNSTNQKNFINRIYKLLYLTDASLITGILDMNYKLKKNKCYNSIIVIDKNHTSLLSTSNRYNKHHLVPFGENLPLNNLLEPLLKLFNVQIFSLNSGKYLQSQLIINDIKFNATICYEIILGKQLLDNFSVDTDFLLNISNNAWFGHSIAPYQYLQIARMRSLELGRPLLHCSNNGITAVINADGTIKIKLPQFINKVLFIDVSPTKGVTLYSKLGSNIIWIIIILICLFSLVMNQK